MTKTTNPRPTTTTARKPGKVVLNFTKRFDDLIQRCASWNAGAYKTANDQLYDLLAETYGEYLEIVNGDTDVRKQFNNLLKARKVPYQDNTPIQTRVVRLVFGIERKRAHTYANVLRLARANNKTTAQIAEWIRESGGVQEVSAAATGKETTAAKAKANATFASDAFAKTDAIADLGKLPAILKPGQAEHPTYSLALIRSANGGSTGEIVWGTDNATAITRVLAIAGKQLREKQTSSAQTKQRRSSSAGTTAAVKDVVLKVTGSAKVKANGKPIKTRTTTSSRKLAA